MPFTDIITLGCIVFLTWRGFSRGFLGSLIGPLALIIASIVSVVYYALTQNIPVSLAIGLLGPMLLAWLLRLFLRSLRNPEEKLSFLSRIGGVIVSLLWGLAMIIITVLLLVLIPPVNEPLKIMSKDIHASLLYSLIQPFDTFSDHKKTPGKTSSSQADIESLSKDKRIQDIVNDPQIADAINRKDYAYLMSNPKIAALMQNPEMIKKMLSIYKDLPPEKKKLP